MTTAEHTAHSGGATYDQVTSELQKRGFFEIDKETADQIQAWVLSKLPLAVIVGTVVTLAASKL